MRTVTIMIPDDLTFDDLQVRREADGRVTLEISVMGEILQASDLALDDLNDDDLTDFLVQWYTSHIGEGGARNATMDDLLSEVAIEDERGQRTSHEPGRA